MTRSTMPIEKTKTAPCAALAVAVCSAQSSFLNEGDIQLAKEWAENLCIPWRTGDGWRSVACRLAHEVERLQKERDQAHAKLALAADTIIESNYYGGFAAPRGAAKVLHEVLGLVLPNGADQRRSPE